MAPEEQAEVVGPPAASFGVSFLEQFVDPDAELDDGHLYESLAALTDEELGAVFVVAAADAPLQQTLVPAEVRAARVFQVVVHSAHARFQPYARKISRKYCIRLSHRSDSKGCSGGCETVRILDGPVLDRIVGSPEPIKRKDGTWQHTLGYFHDWAVSGFRMFGDRTGPAVPFSRHLGRRSHRGWSDEALRAWNDERGLVQRLRVQGKPAALLTSGLMGVLSDDSLLGRVAEPFEWPHPDELADEASAKTWGAAWLDALYVDACQTPVPGQRFDVLRIARRLDAKRWRIDRRPSAARGAGLAYRLLVDRDASLAWQDLVARVDSIVRDHLPNTYRELDRARDATQTSVAVAVGERPDDDDFGGPVDPPAAGSAAGDALDEVLRNEFLAEIHQFLGSSPDVAALRGAGFAIDDFDGLARSLDSARSTIRPEESVASALGRTLRPISLPNDGEIALLDTLIDRVLSIINGEDLP